MDSKPLIPIGSEIQIDKSEIKTDLTQALLNKLPRKINCKVIDYKMTDGSGIGYILVTKEKSKIWIFSNELNEETKLKYDISINEEIGNENIYLDQYIGEFEINGNYKISDLLNPLVLLKWLLYTLKDIF